MTTTTHRAGGIEAEKDDQTKLQKVLLWSLVTWVGLGVVLAVWYANHIILGEWNQSAVLPSYSSNVMFNFFDGAIVWFVGMGVLAVLVWGTHTHRLPR